METCKVKLLLPALFISLIVFSGVALADSNSVIRSSCQGDETVVTGLDNEVNDDSGYGSHIYDPGAVSTPYQVCFWERFGRVEGSFEYGFTGDNCNDLSGQGWKEILDVHDLTDASNEWGSHVAQAGKLCLKHTGLMNVSGRGYNLVGDDYSCPDDYCYLFGTIAKEKNSHLGNDSWDAGEYEVWVNMKENVDEHRLDVNITNPDYYAWDCSVDDECNVTLDPGLGSDACRDRVCPSGFDKCRIYDEYMQDEDGDWVTTVVEMGAETYSSEWGFGLWSGHVPPDEDSGDSPISVNMTKGREITAEFVDVKEPSLDVDIELPEDTELGKNWTSWSNVTVTATDTLSGLDTVKFIWSNSHPEGKDEIKEKFDIGSNHFEEQSRTYNMTDPGNWTLTVEAMDREGNMADNVTLPHLIDGEAPEVNVSYNTTTDGSENVTSKRNVTFKSIASDEFSGVSETEIQVSIDGETTKNEVCDFGGGNPSVANCSFLVNDSSFESLDVVEFNATAWDSTSGGGTFATDSDDFSLCGVTGASIGNGLVSRATCSNGERIRGEDCQDGQEAGFVAQGKGECPPLFINVSASSSVDVDTDDINENIIHPDAEDPILKECDASYGASGDSSTIKGIYKENGFGGAEVPSGDSVNMSSTWNVDDIPYYCRGETIHIDNYTVYEHQDQDDSPVESPHEGVAIDVSEDGSELDGGISFDPTIKKMEYWVTEEANIRTGLTEYVFPMNVTNWNDGPVAVRISWNPMENLFANDWTHSFAREFDVQGYSAKNTSFDDIQSYGSDYGYNRSVEINPSNHDIQLVVGGRNSNKANESFALTVQAPPWAEPGAYFTEVEMTRDEDKLEGSN